MVKSGIMTMPKKVQVISCRHVPDQCSMCPYGGQYRPKLSGPLNDSGGTCPHQNVLDDPALCRHDPPKHGTKASALICYYLDLIVSAIDSP